MRGLTLPVEPVPALGFRFTSAPDILKSVGSVPDEAIADFASMSQPFIIRPDLVRNCQEGCREAARCTICNYVCRDYAG